MAMGELFELVKYNGPGVLVIFGILLFGRKLIEYVFDKSIEVKKTELDQKLEAYKLSLEERSKEFQHELDTKLQEFNIQFSKLHNERASIINQLYRLIIELQLSMEDFTRTMRPVGKNAEEEEKNRLNRVEEALKEVNDYFLPNRIYFKKELAEQVDKLLKEYWSTGWDYARANSRFKSKNLSGQEHSALLDETRKINNSVLQIFPSLIKELENEFRQILGVN